MAARAVPQFRPLLVGTEYDSKSWFKRINWTWLLQRIPMFLFAIVSSYGVGHFLYQSGTPIPFNIVGGISFDLGFLGIIALADMQITKTLASKILYFVLNVGLSALAALFNTLSHSDGKYSNITLESFTAGAPFAVVGLLFAIYYHSVMNGFLDKEEKQQEEDKKASQLTAHKCKFCGEGKPSQAAVYGHYKTCTHRTTHLKTPGKGTCKCLLCDA